jgi:hypothetical protein
MPDTPSSNSIKTMQLISDIYQINGTLFSYASQCIQRLCKGEVLPAIDEQRLLAIKSALMDDHREEKPEKKKRKRVDKDPDAPKRPLTAFFYYFTQHRDRIRKEHPEVSNNELGSIAGKEWKELDAKAREKYKAEAKRMREDYLQQLETYKKAKVDEPIPLIPSSPPPISKFQKETILSEVRSTPTSPQIQEKSSSPINKGEYRHKPDEERRKEKKKKKEKKGKKEKKEKKHQEK